MREIVVATVRRPHGLKGELLVHPETDTPERVFSEGAVFGVDAAGATDLAAEVTLEAAGPQSRGWRLRLREIGDRETAQRYAGCRLVVPEDRLVELEDDEFFLHDLEDLEVQDLSGRPLGRVSWVFDRPGQPVLAVGGLEDGEAATEMLIPFADEIVKEVNLEEGVIRIDPPPGLLEL